MKIHQKKIAGILIALGCIALAIALATSSFKVNDIFRTNSPYVEKSYEVSKDEVNGLEVDLSNTAISILPSNDDKIHITYFENNELSYKFNVKSNRVLSITDSYDRNILNMFGISLTAEEIYCEILLPTEHFDKIDIKTSNAKITIEDLIVPGDLTLKASNESISLTNVTASEDIKVTTSNASIKGKNIIGDSVDFKTSNARIEADNVSAVDKLLLQTSNSSIVVDDVIAGNRIELKTSNARISGTIRDAMDNYSIESSTSNGRNNLPNTNSGNKKLVVRTSNSNIDIEFSNKQD